MTTLLTTVAHPPQFNGAADQPAASATDAGNVRSRSLYARIAQQPLLKGLTPQQLQLLTDSAMEMEFEPGQLIFQAGSPANRFYFILAGRVVLESGLEGRGKIPIQTLGPGDDLGWAGLFPPYILHLSARALESTRTIFFYGSRLREQCEQDHDLGYQLVQRVAEELIQSLRVTQQCLTECAEPSRFSNR
jgi:CRP/FNR family cyclic AMP-dependent transcriptional regulator